MIKRNLMGIMLILFVTTSAFSTKFDNMQTGEFYKVFTQGESLNEQKIATQLDAAFKLYNNFFQYYSQSGPDSQFIVKIFNSKESYKEYISKYEMTTDSQFIFVQFSNKALNELVGYQIDQANFDETLLHYSCIQYIRSHIEKPPLWLEKGVAVYFEKSEYDEQRQAYVYKENLAWLQTLKSALNSDQKLIDINSLLQADNKFVEENSELFYAQAWSLVSLLLNYPDANYNRILWNTIASIEAKASNDENNLKTVEAFNWINKNKFQNDYLDYISQLRTFPDLVQDGIDMYRNKKYAEAEKLFVASLKMKDDNFIPYYYLGLINYNNNDFAMAEFYFNSALQMNGDEGLCFYALAINSYANGNLDDALDYLAITLEKDASFEEKVERLIKTINTEKGFSTDFMADFEEVEDEIEADEVEEEVTIETDEDDAIDEEAIEEDYAEEAEADDFNDSEDENDYEVEEDLEETENFVDEENSEDN